MDESGGRAFTLPRILDLTDPTLELPDAEPGSTADLLFMSKAQLARSLTGIPKRDELPPHAGASMFLIAWGRGFLGAPFCINPSPELDCWPVRGGLDDNPLSWICQCGPPRPDQPETVDDTESTAWIVPEVDEQPCHVGIVRDGRNLRWRCLAETCKGECRLSFSEFANHRWVFCECHRRGE